MTVRTRKLDAMMLDGPTKLTLTHYWTALQIRVGRTGETHEKVDDCPIAVEPIN